MADPKNARIDLERKDRGGYLPLAFEQITSLGTVKTFTRPTQAIKAVVSVSNSGLRWRGDGTDPTTSIGCRVNADSTQIFTGATAIDRMKLIGEDTATVLDVQYYG